MKLRFSLRYAILAVLVLLAEVAIATVFRRVTWMRAYLGDVLVVVLLYFSVLAVVEVKRKDVLAGGLFVFAVAVEILQFFKLADSLGLAPGSLPHILLGNTFSWLDIVCYGLGCLLIVMFVRRR